MLTNLVNCKIEPSYRSDHSMIILELEFIPFVCGKGLWKFNNSLLYDLEYSNIVKKKNLVQFYSLLNLSTYYQEKEINQVELV
jgi:hypothetical protein